MTRTSCQRLFEVEAMRDGRLTGAELASFQRHLALCPTCQDEVKALRKLAEDLRAQSVSEADELHTRRERTRLLAAFDRALVTPGRPSAPRRWMALPLVVAALATAVIVISRQRLAIDRVTVPSAIVRANGDTVWSKHSEGPLEEIVLQRGTLSIQVEHGATPHRLIVVLPDGELQDTGTRFTVSAEDGHTTRVAVEQGSVLLRIHGRSPIALGPGGAWAASPVTATIAVPVAEPIASASVPAAPVAVPIAAPPTTSGPQQPKTTSGTDQDPARDFRVAVAALNSGDNARAASGFEAFLSRHPGDRRAEDAAYLRIIALQRTGNTQRLHLAVDDYLKRYPAGFRHAEVEKLIEW